MFRCPGMDAPMRAHLWTPSEQVVVPWLATVAPLDPEPTRSFKMVTIVSSSVAVTGVWVS